MLHALVNATGEIREYRDHAERPADLPLKGLRWRPVADTDPPFDGATQKRTGPVVNVKADDVTRVWTVTDKTAQELDAEKDAQAASEIDGGRMLKALVRWVAPLVGKTPAQARAEIIAIYKALP